MKTDSSENGSETSDQSYDDSWIARFMCRKENKYICKISENFLQDRFNLYGIKEKIEDFESVYLAIQDKAKSLNEEDEEKLYYLAHQRYVYTTNGLETMLDKVLNWEYGMCSRIGCKEVPLIPIGISNEPYKARTKVYCYNCNNLYEPRGSLKRLDGCAWGTSFAHFFILAYPYHFEKKEYTPYVPRVFGFQIAEQDDCDSA